MSASRSRMDVAVIGAGAAGCVTALAFARRGARVLLLEAHPGASTRLAGEWLHPAGVPVSCTAGLLLEDAELPHEGLGHLVLSGPGPAFIYRIGARHLRACLDVPSGVPRGTEQAAYLWNAYGRALPEALRPAFRRALE